MVVFCTFSHSRFEKIPCVFIIFCQTPHTSWHVSCIPEAYLVHRAEGGEVENLDINPYILTFFIKMHTMHTLHTFFIKFI